MRTCQVYSPKTVMMIKMQDIWCVCWESNSKLRVNQGGSHYSNSREMQCENCAHFIGEEALMREAADIYAGLLRDYNDDLSNAAIRRFYVTMKIRYKLSFKKRNLAEKLGWLIYKDAEKMEEALTEANRRE